VKADNNGSDENERREGGEEVGPAEEGTAFSIPLPKDPRESLLLLFQVKVPEEFFTLWEWVKTVDAKNPLGSISLEYSCSTSTVIAKLFQK
jgi:hypothetical protein